VSNGKVNEGNIQLQSQR